MAVPTHDLVDAARAATIAKPGATQCVYVYCSPAYRELAELTGRPSRVKIGLATRGIDVAAAVERVAEQTNGARRSSTALPERIELLAIIQTHDARSLARISHE